MEARTNGRNNNSHELSTIADHVGRFMQYWGFKKIHGRIWTHIYLSSVPLDAGTLMKRLKVSKALMSLSLHDLLDYGVIQEAGKSDRGTQVYVANPDVTKNILDVLRHREKKMLADTEMAWRQLHTMPETDAQRLQIDTHRIESLGRLIHQAQRTLDAMLELSDLDLSHWQEMGAGGSLPTPKP